MKIVKCKEFVQQEKTTLQQKFETVSKPWHKAKTINRTFQFEQSHWQKPYFV